MDQSRGGIGLASLFSDWSHEIATTVISAFFVMRGRGRVLVGLIKGVPTLAWLGRAVRTPVRKSLLAVAVADDGHDGCDCRIGISVFSPERIVAERLGRRRTPAFARRSRLAAQERAVPSDSRIARGLCFFDLHTSSTYLRKLRRPLTAIS